MRPFRFRADAALQLRRREHDRALVMLAHAQAALRAAQQRVEQADRALDDADERLREAMQTPNPQLPLGWYRSWNVRMREDRRACQERCRAREKEVETATAAASRSQQRVRSLERLHDLAFSAWQREAERVEQKTMDQLASLRFSRREERTFR